MGINTETYTAIQKLSPKWDQTPPLRAQGPMQKRTPKSVRARGEGAEAPSKRALTELAKGKWSWEEAYLIPKIQFHPYFTLYL